MEKTNFIPFGPTKKNFGKIPEWPFLGKISFRWPWLYCCIFRIIQFQYVFSSANFPWWAEVSIENPKLLCRRPEGLRFFLEWSVTRLRLVATTAHDIIQSVKRTRQANPKISIYVVITLTTTIFLQAFFATLSHETDP